MTLSIAGVGIGGLILTQDDGDEMVAAEVEDCEGAGSGVCAWVEEGAAGRRGC